MEKKCKNPKCGKTLVGKEKILCKSCKDQFKEGALQVGKGALGIAISVVALKNIPKNFGRK